MIRFVLVIVSLTILPNVIAGDATWRSSLYPADWKPGYKDSEGRFLQDYSYAGYHNGEKKIPVPTKVNREQDARATLKADSSGESDSQPVTQKLLDQLASKNGGVLYIPEGLYRFDDTLTIRHSNIVIKGAGPDKTKLFFTGPKNDKQSSNILFAGKPTYSKPISLRNDCAIFDTVISLDSIDNLKSGQDVEIGCVITDAFRDEHGMKDYWQFAKGKWRAFFRRTIVAVDKQRKQVKLDVPIRYPLKTRDGASMRTVTGLLSECGIQGLSISDATTWKKAWSRNRFHTLEMSHVKDCWIYDVDSFVAPGNTYHLRSCGIYIKQSERVTVADCSLAKPQNRGSGGNGYLFEICQSNDILIRDCEGHNGRHNFIQNWDFSTNGCVFLRVKTSGGKQLKFSWDPIGFPTGSEYHHALAMANLVDNCVIDDAWKAVNRRNYSSRAGHTSTQNVFWNNSGTGSITSCQFGMGYIIGTIPPLTTHINAWFGQEAGTAPRDFLEGAEKGKSLAPQSLYEDQLNKRTPYTPFDTPYK